MTVALGHHRPGAVDSLKAAAVRLSGFCFGGGDLWSSHLDFS